MNRRAVIVLLAGAIALVGSTTYVVTRNDPVAAPKASGPRVGSAAPNWTLPTIDDRSITFDDTHGNPVVLAFGASWCQPCRKEYPMLQQARRLHAELRVVGVMENDVAGIMRRFMNTVGASWPVANDRDGKVAAQYTVRGLPETFFIRRDGTIAAHITGEMSQEALDKHVAVILTQVP